MTAYRCLVVVCNGCDTKVQYEPGITAWTALRSLKAAGWVRLLDARKRVKADYCEACAKEER